jgi:hypothetical protein
MEKRIPSHFFAGKTETVSSLSAGGDAAKL